MSRVCGRGQCASCRAPRGLTTLRGGIGGHSPPVGAPDPARASPTSARSARAASPTCSSTSRTCRGATSPSRSCRATCAIPSCGACSTPKPTCSRTSRRIPSIVTVYQAGISADGRPYIVMEFCPGSLAQRYRIERIPVDEVLDDRRPDGQRARIRAPRGARAPRRQAEQHPGHDLRRARCWPTSASRRRCTRATADEVLAMSIPWSAPEVIAEQTAGTVASEVWSLGATVYSLLAGHSPFERRERGQNTKEQLRRRIARATLHRHPAHRCPGIPPDGPRARHEPRSARIGTPRHASSPRRCGRSRPSSASRRRRSRSPIDDGRAPRSPVDFADTELRGSGAHPRRARRAAQDAAGRRAWRGSRATRTPNSRRPRRTAGCCRGSSAGDRGRWSPCGGILTALLATGVL